MIYILIILATTGSSQGGATIASIEFNNKAACSAAATEFIRQNKKSPANTDVIFCAEKGK